MNIYFTATSNFVYKWANPVKKSSRQNFPERKRLRKLVENEELRLKMGENGHQHVLNYFSRKKEIEKWKNLYFSLL